MAFINRDVWIGLVMLVVAGVYWLEADKISVSPLDDPVGADGLPKSLAYCLGALAIFMIVRSVVGAFVAIRPAGSEAKSDDADASMKRHLRAIGMLAIGVVYLLLISWLGYMLTVMALIFAVALFIGAPFGLRTVLVALVGGIGFQLLFVEFLDISLPAGALLGPLPGFGN